MCWLITKLSNASAHHVYVAKDMHVPSIITLEIKGEAHENLNIGVIYSFLLFNSGVMVV